MNELQEILKNIGLEDKEAKIYLALLKFGSATVSDIADEAGIKRPTAYVILDELRKKGLVLKIPHAKKSIFQAKSPDEFYEQAASHIHKLENALPKLRAINPSKQGIKTLYFEGIEGIKQAMYYRLVDLKDSTDEGFWAKALNISKGALEIMKRWDIDRKKYNILFSGVTPDHPSTRNFVSFEEGYKDFIFAPLADYDSEISIDVTKEFVRIVDAHDLKAIIIENPRVASALSQIFKLAKEKYKKTTTV